MDSRLKTNIKLFYAISLLQGMVFYGPIATLYRQAQGLSVFDITLIESISLMVLIVLEVPWGYISDRIGYKNTILLCNILFFISKIVFWKADGFIWFLAERLMLSVILAGLSGCDSAFMFISSGEKDSHKVFGTYESLGTAGLIMASMTYSLAVKSDYALSALLTVFSYGVAMVLSLFLTDVRPTATGQQFSNFHIKDILLSASKNRKFLLFLISAALLAESSQTITVFLNQLQFLASGIQPRYMGFIHILITVSALVSVFSFRLTRRFGGTPAAVTLFSLAAISCLTMAVFTTALLSVLAVILLKISASIFLPLSMTIQNRQVDTCFRATILSFYSVCMNIIGIGTNLVFGRLADMGIKYAMFAGAIFCAAGLILYIMWKQIPPGLHKN